MSVTKLLAELTRLGVRFEMRDGRLGYRPHSATPPELIERMKDHKAALLRLMASDTSEPRNALPDRKAGTNPNVAASAAIDDMPAGPVDKIDPAELEPCLKCGTLKLWQTAAGNWRCQRCDPPMEAMRWLEHCERIRKKTKQKADAGRKGQYRV